MNIVRKLKLSKIHSVKFTHSETLIIKNIKVSVSMLSGYLQPAYYDDKYKDNTYYLYNGQIVIRKPHSCASIFVSNIFFNGLKENGIIINEEELKKVLVYFFKEYHLKKEPTVHVLASNYIIDSFKSGWFFEIPL